MKYLQKAFLMLSIVGVSFVFLLTQLAPAGATAAGNAVLPGIVSWWPGEGNADDVIDGNNGALQLGATFAPGKVGQAFSLDGVDDYIHVPDNPNLAFGSNQDFSISAWVNLQIPIPGADDEIVAKWNVENTRNGTTQNFYRLFLQRNTYKVRFALGSENSIFELESDSSVKVGEWTHITAVRDGDQGLIYTNGKLDKMGTLTNGSVANSDPLAIGATYDTLFSPPIQQTNTFGGLIDEVVIYNRALSVSDVESVIKNVIICHKPGTPAQQTLAIPINALNGHLGHGDTIGPCE
jgi:hypothetical protein